MKKIIWPILALLLILCACQPRATSVTILNGEQVLSLFTAKTVPAEILAEVNISLGANDRLLYLGSSIPLDTALPDTRSYTLTVRRAVALTVFTPDGQQTIQTSALTVGQALAEAGFTLYAADRLDPPAETPITGALAVTYRPGREIVVTVDGTQVRVRSAAGMVGQALAEAGVPLVGLDISRPGESASLPEDGQIRVVRVVESVALTQKTIPFSTRTELSADLEIDQQVLLQGGETGLATARLRTRSEDGVQVSQQSESESVVRPPQDRIMGFGTKIVIRTTTMDGETIEYWRALNLFASYYQPCDAGINKCHNGTASGKPVQKGVVAMVYPWYLLFVGEPLYIPGYGFATVEDTNGANTSAYGDTYWIDLGYSQTDSVDWVNHHVTVYFLTPVPANPGYILP
ncbi:MAG TPA: ubiquitin-like domain-containing protein [Anaerolineales bacterium]